VAGGRAGIGRLPGRGRGLRHHQLGRRKT